MAQQKKKDDYLANGLQKAAYNLGLVDNPDVASIRKDAYGTVASRRKPPVPPKKTTSPDKGIRLTHGESTNASHTDRAALDAARARLPRAKAADSGKGNPKTVNAYKAPARKDPTPANPNRGLGEKKASSLPGISRNAYDAYKAPATTPAAPAKKPVSNAPKSNARPSMSKGSSSPPAYTPDKPQKRGNVTSGFSGNWVGAAPTEMQKRGGARINRGGGLLGKLRGK